MVGGKESRGAGPPPIVAELHAFGVSATDADRQEDGFLGTLSAVVSKPQGPADEAPGATSKKNRTWTMGANFGAML